MIAPKVSDSVLQAVKNAISLGHLSCAAIMDYTKLSRSSVKRARAVIRGCPTDTPQVSHRHPPGVPQTPCLTDTPGVSQTPRGVPQTPPSRVDSTISLSIPKKEVSKKEPPLSSPPASREVMAAWNEMAKRTGLAQITAMSPSRERHLSARLREHGLSGVLEAISAVGASDFCHGRNDFEGRSWSASFDWLVERGVAKAREGKFRNRVEPTQAARPTVPWRSEGAYVKPELVEVVT